MANKKFLSLLNRYSVYEFAYFSLVVESLRKTRFSAFSSTEIRCRDLDALPVRILYLGQLIKRKGVDILIESLKSIGSSSFTLTICGNGKLLPNVLESTSADSRVNYIRPIPIDKVAILISEHDIIVAPSRYDGWGSVVVEALAAGKRVITTATTGLGTSNNCRPSVAARTKSVHHLTLPSAGSSNSD
jgi:glycosyltransferase involved in cell wall biosynthesis